MELSTSTRSSLGVEHEADKPAGDNNKDSLLYILTELN